MKLNVAAALFQSNCRLRVRLVTSLILSSLLVLSSGAALALDGIELSEPSEESDEGGCSRLVQIKYPFLSCSGSEIGLAEENEMWENSRQIPVMGAFVEGDGYWGPSLNDPSLNEM